VDFSEDLFKRRIAALLPAKAAKGAPGAQDHPGKAPVDLSGLWAIIDDEQFLQEAYRRILGRECDISGFVNYLEILRRHVPRRVVALQLINSDEGRRSGVRFTGIPEAAAGGHRRGLAASLRQAAGSVLAQVRELLRGPLYSRFDAIDHKLDFVLREVAVRSDGLSARSDEVLWTVSKKLDAYVADVEAQQLQMRDALHAEITANAKAAALVADAVEHVGEAVEHLTQAVTRERESNGRLSDSVQLLSESIGHLRAEVDSLRRHRQPAILTAHNVVATEVDGFILGLPEAEWRLAAYHAFRGVPEPGVTARFLALVRPGAVVVDVGANVGIYTLYAARLLQGRGKIYSFEPAPETFRLLHENVQVNGYLETGLVEMHQAAVTDRAGCAQLAVFAGDSGHNTLFWDQECERVGVQTLTLDQILEREPRVDVVKIDAEGSEPLVLRGMRRVVERSPGIRILLEFAPSLLRRAGVEPAAFMDEIAATGFDIRRIHDETGELLEVRREELLSCFSANLELGRVPEATPASA